MPHGGGNRHGQRSGLGGAQERGSAGGKLGGFEDYLGRVDIRLCGWTVSVTKTYRDGKARGELRSAVALSTVCRM